MLLQRTVLEELQQLFDDGVVNERRPRMIEALETGFVSQATVKEGAFYLNSYTNLLSLTLYLFFNTLFVYSSNINHCSKVQHFSKFQHSSNALSHNSLSYVQCCTFNVYIACLTCCSQLRAAVLGAVLSLLSITTHTRWLLGPVPTPSPSTVLSLNSWCTESSRATRRGSSPIDSKKLLSTWIRHREYPVWERLASCPDVLSRSFLFVKNTGHPETAFYMVSAGFGWIQNFNAHLYRVSRSENSCLNPKDELVLNYSFNFQNSLRETAFISLSLTWHEYAFTILTIHALQFSQFLIPNICVARSISALIVLQIGVRRRFRHQLPRNRIRCPSQNKPEHGHLEGRLLHLRRGWEVWCNHQMGSSRTTQDSRWW